MIDDGAIAEILAGETEPQAASEVLVEAANAAGGYDNVTAMVIDWPGRS